MLKEEKKVLLSNFQEELKENPIVVLLSHQKVTFKQIDNVKKKNPSNKIKKVKNRIAKLAFNNEYKNFNEHLSKENLLILSKDLFSACKTAEQLTQENQTIKIIECITKEQSYTQETIKMIAQFDSETHLKVKILLTLKAIPQKILILLTAKASKSIA